ncbi:MAG: 3-phosphoshikimate 1-carboxyvinyltransferase [Bacteroidota bacterium]|nr:3-phosphoshikimate 1-carboxyvinyltransferase [Bacteroidota bacterium]
MVEINASSNKIEGCVQLSASKSISNRLLMIKAISNSSFELYNLSESDDTQILNQILSNTSLPNEINCHHAGTTLRFLTAYLSTIKGTFRVFGSDRMHQRPIKPLVDCIRKLGIEIRYLENEGFPPIEILGNETIEGGELTIPGNISSQFISALLLIAPKLKNGLSLRIIDPILSIPYIKMTLSLMQEMGIKYVWDKNTIHIEHQAYSTRNLAAENDWSSSSFIYSLASLSNESKIEIPHLYSESVQGDFYVSELYSHLGVETSFHKGGITIKKNNQVSTKLEFNLSDFPDLAIPYVVSCAGLGIEVYLSGLESLKIKESDRLVSIKKELSKFNVECEINDHSIYVPKNQLIRYNGMVIDDHNDHRIPMSIAPLAIKTEGSIFFKDSLVVNKSYPLFWDDLKKLGFNIVN